MSARPSAVGNWARAVAKTCSNRLAHGLRSRPVDTPLTDEPLTPQLTEHVWNGSRTSLSLILPRPPPNRPQMALPIHVRTQLCWLLVKVANAASSLTCASLRPARMPDGQAAISAGDAVTPGHCAAAVHTCAKKASTLSVVASGLVVAHAAKTTMTLPNAFLVGIPPPSRLNKHRKHKRQ